MKLKVSNIQNKLYWIVGLLFVYGNGSEISLNIRNIFNVLIVFSVCILVLFNLLKKKDGAIASPNPIVLFFAIFPIFGLFYASSDINYISIGYSFILLILLSSLSFKDLHELLEKYAQIIYYLSIISIPLGIIFLVNYNLIMNFPTMEGSMMEIYNLGVYTDRIINDFRVQSIYWEPGAWAVNLAFSLYWFSYINRDKKRVFIIIIAMLLAFSTSGFLLISLILLSYLFYAKDLIINRKTLIVSISIAVLLISVNVYLASNMDFDLIGLVERQTTEKFQASGGSYDDRKETAQKAFQIAIENPFIGIGKQNQETSLFVTSSLAEISYQLGLVFSIVYVFVFLYFFRKMGIIFGSLFGLILLNAEAYAFYILFSLILVYSSVQFFNDKFKNHQV